MEPEKRRLAKLAELVRTRRLSGRTWLAVAGVAAVVVSVGLAITLWHADGAALLDSDQDRLEYWRSKSGLYPIRQDEQYGFVNESGDVAVSPQFQNAGEFSEKLAPVRFDGKWGYIDRKGRYVVNPQFDHVSPFYGGRAAVELEDQWGYIDQKGAIVINPQFNEADRFRDGLARVRQDDRWGFINPGGEYVINPQFDRSGVFTEGLAPVAVGSKFGYVDETGTYHINLQFDDAAPFREGLGRVRSGDRFGFVDRSGKYVINPQFAAAGDFHENRALVRVGSRWGYVDLQGKFVINPQFNAGGDFRNGLAIVQIGERFGFVDRSGKVVINPQFESVFPFAANGMASVNSEGKWGFVNRKGKLVVAPQFASATSFFGTLAFVLVDRFSGGYINARGEFVWKLEPPARIAEAIRLGRALDDPSHHEVFQTLRQFIVTTRGLIQSSWSSGNLDAPALAAQTAKGKTILTRIGALRQQIVADSFTVTEVGQLAGNVGTALAAMESRLAELVRQLEAAPRTIASAANYDAWQQNRQVYDEIWQKLHDLDGADPLDRGKDRVLRSFGLYPSDLQVGRQEASTAVDDAAPAEPAAETLPDPPPPPPPPPRALPTAELEQSFFRTPNEPGQITPSSFAQVDSLKQRLRGQIRNDELWGDLGDAFGRIGEQARSARCYAIALLLDAHDSEWPGKARDMRGIPSMLRELDVTSDEFIGDLGDAALRAGERPLARELYSWASQIDPRDSEWTGKLQRL